MGKFDVVIVGSGLGGLLCGYILGKAGYKVIILEKNNQTGGCLQTFYHAKEKFDTGMHYIGSAAPGQVMNRFFNYFSLLDDVKLRKLDENAFDIFSINNKHYKYAMGFDRYVEGLVADFPSERQNIEKYVEKINMIASQSPLYNLEEVNNHVFLNIESVKSSVNEFVESITDNPELRNVLVGNLPLYAGIADVTPLYIHALINKFYIQSSYRIVGGSDSIVKSLEKSIKSFGGEIYSNAEVVEFICDTEKVVSVSLKNGELIEGKNFISNIHPYAIVNKLHTPLIRRAYKQRITQLSNTISNFTVYIKFKPKTVKYLNSNFYYYAKDVWGCENYNEENWPLNYLFMHQAPVDGSDYAASAILIGYMHIDDVKQWKDTYINMRGENYQQFKQQKSKILLNSLEKSFPGIQSKIESYTSSTPLTYRDYTATKDGSMYGVLRDKNFPMQTLVSQRTRIPNLFMTGQNINSHGILGVTIGAIITCSEFLDINKIINDIKKA